VNMDWVTADLPQLLRCLELGPRPTEQQETKLRTKRTAGSLARLRINVRVPPKSWGHYLFEKLVITYTKR